MYENKFWQGNHELSSVNNVLQQRLVPDSGEALTPHGELLNCMNQLYFEVYKREFRNEKALAPLIEKVQAQKVHVALFLNDQTSWPGDLGSVLRQAALHDEPFGAPVSHLEDVMAAVVRYVTQADREFAWRSK